MKLGKEIESLARGYSRVFENHRKAAQAILGK